MSDSDPDFSTSLSASGQPQPDVQHGVIANNLWPIKMVGGVPRRNQKRAIFTTILRRKRDDAKRKVERESNQESIDAFDFVTWENFANVQFEETKNRRGSHIRITFTGKGFRSAVGTKAGERGDTDPTMGLGGLKDVFPPSESDRRHILHEFGHALGLRHEHQGPAAQKLLKLDEDLLKEDKGAQKAQKNFLSKIEEDENLWNYTNFDPESIMIYRIRTKWQCQESKIKIGYALKLSKYDEACITLMYPPDLTQDDNQRRLMNALHTVGIDEKTAGEVIQEFTNDSEGNVAERLTRLRDRFYIWNTKTLQMYNSDTGILRGIDPESLRRSGTQQFVGEVTKNKLFQSIMKNLLYRTMVQHGIPNKAVIPGAAQTEVTKLVTETLTWCPWGSVGDLGVECTCMECCLCVSN